MNGQRKERMVNDVLDRALGPEMVEPRDGFEQRMLANVAMAPERRRWWRWMWVPAVAAAMVMGVIGIRVAMRRGVPSAPQVVQQQIPNSSDSNEAADKSQFKDAPRHHAAIARTAPRSRVNSSRQSTNTVSRVQPARPFPPAALTNAERALVAMLRNNPDEAQLLLQRQEDTRKQSDTFLQSLGADRSDGQF